MKRKRDKGDKMCPDMQISVSKYRVPECSDVCMYGHVCNFACVNRLVLICLCLCTSYEEKKKIRLNNKTDSMAGYN